MAHHMELSLTSTPVTVGDSGCEGCGGVVVGLWHRQRDCERAQHPHAIDSVCRREGVDRKHVLTAHPSSVFSGSIIVRPIHIIYDRAMRVDPNISK